MRSFFEQRRHQVLCDLPLPDYFRPQHSQSQETDHGEEVGRVEDYCDAPGELNALLEDPAEGQYVVGEQAETAEEHVTCSKGQQLEVDRGDIIGQDV